MDGEGKITEGRTLIELKNFLSTPENPVSPVEFREFWESCTMEEREQFKQLHAEASAQ